MIIPLFDINAIMTFFDRWAIIFSPLELIFMLMSAISTVVFAFYFHFSNKIDKFFSDIEQAENLLKKDNVVLLKGVVEIKSSGRTRGYGIMKKIDPEYAKEELRITIAEEKARIKRLAVWPFHNFYTRQL